MKSPGSKWWERSSLVPFHGPGSICVVGATASGKTCWIYKMLQNLNGMFDGAPPPCQVLYCYGIHQKLYDDMSTTLPNFSLHEGLPTEEKLDEFTDGQHKLVILDDLVQDVVKNANMERLFTQGCHHRNISVIFVMQNLFQQGKCARTISLNVHYMVLFRNLRDALQILHLGRQLYPGKSDILLEAYRDSVKAPYGYIVIDMSPNADDKYRLRTHIFPGEDTVIYLPRV